MTPEEHFAASLRRLLHFQQIMKHEIEWFKGLTVTPPLLKNEVNGILNAINRFERNCAARDKNGSWDKIKSDLNRDQVFDIARLIDAIVDVENIGDIVDVILKTKQPNDNIIPKD